jgi:hypothetical protein
VREHVTARLAPLLVRQESADQISNDHDRRIAELERRLAEIEAKAATLRRVA